MTQRQRSILIGMILGDAYIQSTGKKNARIRLEQSLKQKDYLMWKGEQFPEFFQGKPTKLVRFNEKFGKSYEYIRWQSNSSPEIGRMRKHFYEENGKKIVPGDIREILTDPLSVAVWYMDDGYYYHRDKIAYIYLSNYSSLEFELLISTLKNNFSLSPGLKKKTLGWCFVFSVSDTEKLLSLVEPHIIGSMKSKLPFDPVSTIRLARMT